MPVEGGDFHRRVKRIYIQPLLQKRAHSVQEISYIMNSSWIIADALQNPGQAVAIQQMFQNQRALGIELLRLIRALDQQVVFGPHEYIGAHVFDEFIHP